jgi:DNA-binding protein HU-beta
MKTIKRPKLVEEIIETAKIEGSVKLHGLGIFEIRKNKARKGVNPITGERIQIPESRRLAFKQSAKAKRLVNE